MALSKVNAFVGSAEFGKALDRQPLRYVATFSDGSTTKLAGSNLEAAMGDAAFWAGFTNRTIVSVDAS